MFSLQQLVAVAILAFPWANPTWVTVSSAPLDLTSERIVLSVKKPLRVDDDYAHIQIDIGSITPEISEAILHRTFDKEAAKALHVELCRAKEDCVLLQFKGMSFSHEYYDAGYFIPNGVKRGDKFTQVRIWSEDPIRIAVVHWVSGDTG